MFEYGEHKLFTHYASLANKFFLLVFTLLQSIINYSRRINNNSKVYFPPLCNIIDFFGAVLKKRIINYKHQN